MDRARTHMSDERNFAVGDAETPPRALQTSECNELLDPTRKSCLILFQRQPGKLHETQLSLRCVTQDSCDAASISFATREIRDTIAKEQRRGRGRSSWLAEPRRDQVHISDDSVNVPFAFVRLS